MTTATPAAVAFAVLVPPSPSLVLLLQSVQGSPCVSVLMTTTPAAAMRVDEATRLRSLVAEAEDRLGREGFPGAAATVSAPLRRRLEQAVAGPTDAAVALFASQAVDAVVHLPIPVHDRVVVDPTLATRDLVRSLHRTPRHLVLVLRDDGAELLDGVAEDLRPVQGSRFPLRATEACPPGSLAWLRTVDRALTAHYRTHAAPLVLVAEPVLAAAFRRRTRATTRVAGSVTPRPGAAPGDVAGLTRRIRPVLDAYLRGREAEALRLLARRHRSSRAVTGIADCWLAARHELPEMLVVDPTLVVPARLSADGDHVEPVDHPGGPGHRRRARPRPRRMGGLHRRIAGARTVRRGRHHAPRLTGG